MNVHFVMVGVSPDAQTLLVDMGVRVLRLRASTEMGGRAVVSKRLVTL